MPKEIPDIVQAVTDQQVLFREGRSVVNEAKKDLRELQHQISRGEAGSLDPLHGAVIIKFGLKENYGDILGYFFKMREAAEKYREQLVIEAKFGNEEALQQGKITSLKTATLKAPGMSVKFVPSEDVWPPDAKISLTTDPVVEYSFLGNTPSTYIENIEMIPEGNSLLIADNDASEVQLTSPGDTSALTTAFDLRIRMYIFGNSAIEGFFRGYDVPQWDKLIEMARSSEAQKASKIIA